MSIPRRARRLAAAASLAAVGLAVVVALQPPLVFSVLESAFPGILWRVDTQDPLVALSFDDGPHREFTPRVLEILARHRAHATRRSTLREDDTSFLETLAFTDKVLGIGTNEPRLFRPPGGIARSSQLDLARRHGHTIVLGSAYPYDGQRPPAWYIRWLVTKNLAPGVIVILHDGVEDPSRAIEALPSILEAGAAKGLRFVTVGELLAHQRGIKRLGTD